MLSEPQPTTIFLPADKPDLSITRAEAQQIADHLFSRRRRLQAKQDTFQKVIDKHRREKRWDRRKQVERLRARRGGPLFRKTTPESQITRIHKIVEPPKSRCWDWILHSGDIHYAKNASTFLHYTKIDAYAHNIPPNSPPIKALGIGTVKVNAMRALDSENICEITLHDVLHIPQMPCNGISQMKLEEMGLRIWTGEEGLQVCEPSGAWMFCGTKEKGWEVCFGWRCLMRGGRRVRYRKGWSWQR